MRASVCLLALVSLLLGTGLGAPTTTTAVAAARTSGWLHTDGSTLRTAGGRVHVIRAISWFGMETDACTLHGLRRTTLDRGLRRIATLGFNTVRVPFSNQCLHRAGTLATMDQVVRRARAHGLSVLLDRHRPGSAAQSALWYTSRWRESRWIADWTMLARRYRDDPTVIGADLHNEPHGRACWGCGARSRDWRAAATRAGNAVLAANPHWLIVIEGVERQRAAAPTWWGGGLADVARHPVRLRVAHRVVYSAHDYPSSIYPQPWFGAASYPRNLTAVWDRNWGYLQRRDVAPVLLGEFGSRLQTRSDRQWLATLVGYLHTNAMSFGYWSFNPDSGDTGGIVTDDWVTPERAKVAALAPLLGRR